jgi:hypothetical protein
VPGGAGRLELAPGEGADAGAQWGGSIEGAELVLAGRWTVDAVRLHTRLSPLERLRLVASELTAPRPYVPSSSNSIPPRWTLQASLIAWLGGLSAAALLLAAARPSMPWVQALLLCGLLLSTAGPLRSLAAHAAAAGENSAFRDGARDEEVSRYGADFAALADLVRERLPRHAVLLFPRDSEHPVESESHWKDLHFWPAYRSVPLDQPDPAQADFVVWYRPLFWRWDRARAVVVDEHGAVVVRVAPLVELDPGRAILKVLKGAQ